MKKTAAWIMFLMAGILSAQLPEQLEYTDVTGKDFDFLGTADAASFLKRDKDNLNAYLFRWTSDQKTDARYFNYNSKNRTGRKSNVTMFGLDICEMIARFKDGKADSLYVVFYSRGDMQELGEIAFEERCETLRKKLEEFTGVKGEETKGKLTRKDRIYRYLYITEKNVFELKWSIRRQEKGFSYEYIQLEIYRFDPENDPRKESVSRTASETGVKNTLTENLEKEDGGTWIGNIPMVDQGPKGYCVPAVLERVLRYYGNEDVSQHVLAQLMESESGQGTRVDATIPAIKKVSTKMGVRVSPSYQRHENIKELLKILKKYNSFAKRADKDKVEPYTEKVGNTTCYYFGKTLEQLDPEVAKTMWVAQKNDYAKFRKFIRNNITKGIPVVWGVQLGMFPEENLGQAGGGHMRLIIGISDEDDAVYYSDSWGAGHEKKKMSMDEAWTITTAYFSLLPRK